MCGCLVCVGVLCVFECICVEVFLDVFVFTS